MIILIKDELSYYILPLYFISSGTYSNGTTITQNTNHNVSNQYGTTIQPSVNHQQIGPNNASQGPSIINVPSHVSNNGAVNNSQQTVAPTQNSIYLSIACGDEQTRHRFCLVVQMMCSLLQKNGQSADAINQFTERFKYLKEQADLSPQNEETFLKALSNFGNFTEVQTYNHSINNQSGHVNHNSTNNVVETVNQSSGNSSNPPEIIATPKTDALPTARKRRSSARRVRCGSCEGCMNHNRTKDCRACRNCLDQKRYGGPGKLKKACLKRLCLVLSSSSTSPASQAPTQPAVSQPTSSNISTNNSNHLPLDVPLPQHPMPISALNGSLNPGSSGSLVGQIKRVELQVHHHPSQLQQPRSVVNEQPNTLTNHIQPQLQHSNAGGVRQQQIITTTNLPTSATQGQHRQRMPVISMPQLITQSPQVRAQDHITLPLKQQ